MLWILLVIALLIPLSGCTAILCLNDRIQGTSTFYASCHKGN